MNVKELIKKLEQYEDYTDIFVLENRRNGPDGAGKLLKLLNINEVTDQDTNKVSLYIKTGI